MTGACAGSLHRAQEERRGQRIDVKLGRSFIGDGVGDGRDIFGSHDGLFAPCAAAGEEGHTRPRFKVHAGAGLFDDAIAFETHQHALVGKDGTGLISTGDPEQVSMVDGTKKNADQDFPSAGLARFGTLGRLKHLFGFSMPEIDGSSHCRISLSHKMERRRYAASRSLQT